MKKHLLIVICAILVIAFTSISLLVYIDLFKPSIHGAEKAYNNQEYQKAESIYMKVLEFSSGNDEIDAVLGLSKTYISMRKFDECEGLLETYYKKYPNKPRIIKRLSRFYRRDGYEEKNKNFLIDLYNRKDAKKVNNLVKKPKSVSLDVEDEALVPIYELVYQMANSFRNQSVNISADNKNKDVENIVKSAILYNNLTSEPDENSRKIFDLYGCNFSEYVNVENYRAIYIYQVNEKVKALYDFKKFTVNDDAFIYRIIDSSGLPDVFKNNTLIFAKCSVEDREVIYFPVIEFAQDKMTGKYIVEGYIYSFNLSDIDNHNSVSYQKKIKSLVNTLKYKISNKVVRELSSHSERVSRFQIVIRQTTVEEPCFKVVSYKTK